MSPREGWGREEREWSPAESTAKRVSVVAALRAMAKHAVEKGHVCPYVSQGSREAAMLAIEAGWVEPQRIADVMHHHLQMAGGMHVKMAPPAYAAFVDDIADAIEGDTMGSSYIGPIRGEVC